MLDQQGVSNDRTRIHKPNGLLKIYNPRNSGGPRSEAISIHIKSACAFRNSKAPSSMASWSSPGIGVSTGLLQILQKSHHPPAVTEASLRRPPAHPAALLRSAARAPRSAAWAQPWLPPTSRLPRLRRTRPGWSQGAWHQRDRFGRGASHWGDATGNAAWITPYEFDSWWTKHNLVMSLGVKPMAALFHMVTAGFVHWRNRNSMGWSALFHQIQTWHWIVGKNDVPTSRSIRWLSWTTSCEFDWRL